MRRLVLLSATVAAFGLAACGGGDGINSNACLTTDTSQRLCGEDAVNWCKATDATRKLKIELSLKVDDTKALSQLRARSQRCYELVGK